MKLYEYMGKELFDGYRVPLPGGRVVQEAHEAARAAEELGGVVLKAQVLTGKRGKAGAISFADNPSQAEEEASRLLQMEVGGEKVERLLVEEKLPLERELYLAITVEAEARQPVVLASLYGGMDIEEVPEEHIVKYPVEVLTGYSPYIAREICDRLGLEGKVVRSFAAVLESIYRLFREKDAELVEINPLALSGEEFLALDSKVVIDDDALYRQKEIPRVEEKTSLEKKAQEMGLAYVDLGGDVAVMANGAGITMATLDLVQHFGGTPANFLDFGGGAGEEKTSGALELLLGTDPRVILINIFGGITRCDVVARAFVSVKEKQGISIPFFFRLVGTNEAEGRRVLHDAGVEVFQSMEEAVQRAVEASKNNAGGGF